MHGDGWWFFGMHAYWWLFWVVLLIGVFALFNRAPGGRPRTPESPLEIRQRRYAAGEISTEEYEARKAVLERDAATMERGP